MNKKLDPTQRYSLGASFPNVYFNHREICIMVNLLHGKPTIAIADQLNCTSRTIIFYIEGIKKMLACKSINQIIACFKKSALVKEIGVE